MPRRRRVRTRGIAPTWSFPLLAGAAWMAANSERFALIPGFPESAVPHARPLADGLWTTYASDASGAWEVVQRGQVDELGGADRLHALALENLRRRVADDVAVGGGGTRYAFEVESERDLTASLALSRHAAVAPGTRPDALRPRGRQAGGAHPLRPRGRSHRGSPPTPRTNARGEPA